MRSAPYCLPLFALLLAGAPGFAFAQSADLAITKTDGVTTATAGGSVTYTITASNAGPDAANGATVEDTFPASLTCTWTCVGAGGGTCVAAGSGNISGSVDLPAGASVTYTASCTISAAATGSLANTATVTAPGGVTDGTLGNNTAIDTDTIGRSADLAITKTDGVTSATPGGSVTYTITASNSGPSNATGSTVADTFPASLTCTWTCVGAGGGTCTASGSGNINDTVNLPSGGSTTYTASCTVSAAATGTLSNTATVATSGGVSDPTPGNNSATDTDTLTAGADLAITITDGVTSATPGTTVIYTITASNAGPSNASGSTVADTFPASLTCTWTCVGAGGGTCTASGSGNINDTVNLPSGGSTTYSANCAVSAAATGTLSNTATVATSGGVSDPTPGNNSATDTEPLVPAVDLILTKTDNQASLATGATAVYTIVVLNDGPSNVAGATVQDIIPATLSNATWTCTSLGGGTCTASGTGDITDTVDLPRNASVTYTLTATSVSTGANVVNTAAVSSSASVTDFDLTNNTATDTDTTTGTTPPVATYDIALAIDASATTARAGDALNYTVRVSNAGPDSAPSVSLTVTLPLAVSVVEVPASCTQAGTVVTCTLANLATGNAPTLTIRTTVKDNVVNNTDLSASTALITSDTNAANNQSTVTVTASVPANNGNDGGDSADDEGCAAGGAGLLPALAAAGLLWRRRRTALRGANW